ncbi:MAG: winged helix-turn-helix transcriptional regulator [Deltaproteobacteria bacterium]|nr:winged helix-turn-helix transcriptional regulator [Deltaproteobacteria bacterium]
MSQKKVKLIEEDGCLVKIIHLDRVTKARKQAIPERELNRLALIFKAIADPTRLKIAMALKEGEMCVCDLAALLGVSDSAVSHQIRRLKDLALVKSRRDGQVLYYSLDDEHISDLLGVGLEHIRE